MPKIKCHEGKCTSNFCSHCTRDSISVDEKAKCCSFEKRQVERIEEEIVRLQEEYGKENDVTSLDEHYIDCQSRDCSHNFSGVCSLPNMRVDEKNTQAQCISYSHR